MKNRKCFLFILILLCLSLMILVYAQSFDSGNVILNDKDKVSGEIITTENLNVGDVFYLDDGRKARVTGVEDIVGENYNFDNLNFFANGVLVHNKNGLGDKVLVSVNGKKEIGFIESLTGDEAVVKISINKPERYYAGDLVVVLENDGVWRDAQIIQLLSENRAEISFLDVNLDKTFRKDVGLGEIYKFSGDSHYVTVKVPELTNLNRDRTLERMISDALDNKEIAAIDSKQLDAGVKSVYRIKNADLSKMIEIREGRMYSVAQGVPTTTGGPQKGVLSNYVLTKKGKLIIANRCPLRDETGIKHIQEALGEDVVFAGHMTRGSNGELLFDLRSGTFSRYGLNLQYESGQMANVENARAFLQKAMPNEQAVFVDNALEELFQNR